MTRAQEVDVEQQRRELIERQFQEAGERNRQWELCRIQEKAFKAIGDAAYEWGNGFPQAASDNRTAMAMAGRKDCDRCELDPGWDAGLPLPDPEALADLLIGYTDHLKAAGAAAFVESLREPMPPVEQTGPRLYWCNWEAGRELVADAINHGRAAVVARLTRWFAEGRRTGLLPIYESLRHVVQTETEISGPGLLNRLVVMVRRHADALTVTLEEMEWLVGNAITVKTMQNNKDTRPEPVAHGRPERFNYRQMVQWFRVKEWPAPPSEQQATADLAARPAATRKHRRTTA